MAETLLKTQQRDVIQVGTMINRMIIDRCVDAFDALERDDIGAYVNYITTATTMLGYTGTIPDSHRPTAVDKMKTILTRAYADRHRMSFKQAHARLQAQILEGAGTGGDSNR